MKTTKTILALFLMALVSLLAVPAARAIRPLYSPFSVVAGTLCASGFQDGSFNTARFNQPLGLTLSDDGSRLFVADSLNNRIRVIHLDQNNEVGTVAGQGAPGNSDGPLTLAQFHEPRGILYLPGDYLAVNDFGNQSLRFVDLKTGMVTTYRGGPVRLDGSDAPRPNATPTPALKPPVLLNGIKDMAYLPKAHSILFTQPEAGVLNALNLGTGQITAVLKDNAQLPHPSALWIQDDKIYVADMDLLNVFSMDWKNDAVTDMRPAGSPADKVLSLTFSDNTLYGLLKKDGYPAERFLLDKRYEKDDGSNGLVGFNNGFGDNVPPDKFWYESIQPNSPWAGFVPDPSGKRQFFFSIPSMHLVVSLRDRFGNGGSVGLSLGGEYPADKPKNTYRILLVGACLVTDTDDFILQTETHPTATGKTSVIPWNYSFAPQVERELNFRAALDDNPMNYEFLNAGHHGDLLFYPNVELPDKVKKLDIDQVIIFCPNSDFPAYYYYYQYNLTPDGIPQTPPNMEYALKPPLERIPDGLPRQFYDYCKEHHWVVVNGNNLSFNDAAIAADPKAHDMSLEFWGKPWDLLNRKFSSMRTSGGQPVKLLILLGYEGTHTPDNYSPDLFKEVARKYHIPILDLIPYENALNFSYFPMTSTGHLDPNGAVFMGKLLARLLPDENLIPWPTPEKTPAK